ncbi:unnamed protein product [Nippostrongylus brasiliensis]|uniref:Protein Ycf2-like n=1 Tax=Nippostrongylus brasiliensis TaxID=27835 RepID=A0A0N4YV70_NIPBR|nr:unnamed protein product [Nippostrongylus brasiliensis]
MQNLQMKIRFTKDKIVAAMQGVAMSYDVYGLLVTAKKQISDLGTAAGRDRAKKGAETEPSKRRRLSIEDDEGEEVQDLKGEAGRQKGGSGAAEVKAKGSRRGDLLDLKYVEPASERLQKEVRQMAWQNDDSEVQEALIHSEQEKRLKVSSMSDGKVHRSIYYVAAMVISETDIYFQTIKLVVYFNIHRNGKYFCNNLIQRIKQEKAKNPRKDGRGHADIIRRTS